MLSATTIRAGYLVCDSDGFLRDVFGVLVASDGRHRSCRDTGSGGVSVTSSGLVQSYPGVCLVATILNSVLVQAFTLVGS
jgi:hypothetical protein